MRLNKRTLTILSVALLFVGAGSAALLDTFGTVEADSDVQQSVHFGEEGDGVDDELTASYNGDVVAGTKHSETFELHNDADSKALVRLDSNVNPKDWGADPDQGEKGITQTVYEGEYKTQDFTALPTADVAGQLDISVTPAEEQVKYELDLPESYQNGTVDLEISRNGEDNYHVKFYPNPNTNDEGWGYKDPSTADDVSTDVGSLEEIEELNKEDTDDDGYVDSLTITVERDSGYDQTFGIHAYDGSTWFQNPAWDTESYSDSTQAHHVKPNMDLVYDDEVIGEKLTLDSDSERNFKVETDFAVALAPEPDKPGQNDNYDNDAGAYKVNLDVVPVTDDGEVPS
jgi:hypothetical protein